MNCQKQSNLSILRRFYRYGQERRLIEAAQGGNVHVLHNLIKDDLLLLKTMALALGERATKDVS